MYKITLYGAIIGWNYLQQSIGDLFSNIPWKPEERTRLAEALDIDLGELKYSITYAICLARPSVS